MLLHSGLGRNKGVGAQVIDRKKWVVIGLQGGLETTALDFPHIVPLHPNGDFAKTETRKQPPRGKENGKGREEGKSLEKKKPERER